MDKTENTLPVTREEAVRFCEHALRNIGTLHLTWDDIDDIADSLTAFRNKALASHPPSDSWQPIETAPQEDGREILGYQATAGDYEGRQAVCYCLRGMYFASNGLAPTHWLPLPVPPKDHSHGG